VIEVRPTATPAEEQLSLDIYNAVWPRDAITMAEVESFRAAALAHIDMLAYDDGVAGGSLAVGIMPSRPQRGLLILTVLPERRRHGLGSALHRAASDWLRAQGVYEAAAPVPEDDSDTIRRKVSRS
jgi:GNAT superfamily N-acetyltransferase